MVAEDEDNEYHLQLHEHGSPTWETMHTFSTEISR